MQDNNISKKKKPDCPLIGQNGNIFNLISLASRSLNQYGLTDQAKEMSQRIYACGSYDKALCIIGEYVNITSIHDEPAQKESICNRLREIKTSNLSELSKSVKDQEL